MKFIAISSVHRNQISIKEQTIQIFLENLSVFVKGLRETILFFPSNDHPNRVSYLVAGLMVYSSYLYIHNSIIC